MKTIKELHVLVGLPGSGKTTFASQYSDRVRDSYGFSYVNSKAKKFADIIDYDAIYKKVGFKSDKVFFVTLYIFGKLRSTMFFSKRIRVISVRK